MRTFKFKTEKQMIDFTSLITKRLSTQTSPNKYSNHGWNVWTYINEKYKFCVYIDNLTVSVDHFNWDLLK